VAAFRGLYLGCGICLAVVAAAISRGNLTAAIAGRRNAGAARFHSLRALTAACAGTGG